MTEFEYHVMGAAGVNGLQHEIDKRAREGWEPVLITVQVGAMLAKERFTVVFRRPTPAAAE